MRELKKVGAGLRVLSDQEVESVAGAGKTQVTHQGDRIITEYFDSNNNFIGATYVNTDGSGGRWFDYASQTSGNLSVYGSVGYGYMGFVGSLSQVYGGDTYGSIGIGMPGPSVATGLDLDGDLSGVTVTLNHDGGLTVPFDPISLSAEGIEMGDAGSSVMVTVNFSDMQRALYEGVETFARGFVQQYYPQLYPEGYNEIPR